MTVGSVGVMSRAWQRISLEHAGDTLFVTLDNVRTRNSVDHVLLEELIALSFDLLTCDDVHFVVFDHKGPVFSSGANISSVVQLLESESEVVRRGLRVQQRLGQQMVTALEGIGQITVAKVRGGAYGAGATIMMATDFRVMANDSVFSLPESRVGTFLSWGCTPRLVEAVGALKAKEMIMLAEDVPAAECVRLGLANAAVDTDVMDAWVTDLIGKLRGRGELALEITKKLISSSSVPSGSNGQFLEGYLFESIAASGQLLDGFRKVTDR